MMPWTEKDTRIHINQLQFLQKQINFLSKVYETNPDPAFEKSLQNLRSSQNKLYGSLVKHGVTADEMVKIIAENNDRKIVADVIKLQKAVESTEQQLANHNLSAQKRKLLENSLAQTSQEYDAKWDETINSLNKDELINKIEQAQIKQLQKEQARDRTREHNRSR